MECPTLGFICSLILFTSLGFQNSYGQSFSLQMYHKYSHEVKEWMTSRHGLDTDGWPVEGSNEYYKALYHHDSFRHGRKLANYTPLTFSQGNKTNMISDLGYLFYSWVQLGTPKVTLLVALDTGSDVFWVPCDCQACANTSGAAYGIDFNLQTYSPSASQTSKPIACNSNLCQLQNECTKSSDQCPYYVPYVSANTSTAGTLVEDILYLTPGNGSQNGTVVTAPITFGCGNVQTGSFLQGAAPDGLLGLGTESISVPTILYNSGLVSNSFSMCFPNNSFSSVGRFTFGDKGSSDQKETPFLTDQTQTTYSVGVTEFYVGNATIQIEFDALFDTGTSFTLLSDPIYQGLTSNYNLQTNDSPLTVDNQSIPFEFCYELSNSQSINLGPSITFKFNGGNNFSIIQPLLFFQTRNLNFYCLAVLNSGDITTIIGQNFMAGYQLVFDREASKLGWKEANCNELSYNGSSLPKISPSSYANRLSLSFMHIFLNFSFSISILTFLFQMINLH